MIYKNVALIVYNQKYQEADLASSRQLIASICISSGKLMPLIDIVQMKQDLAGTIRRKVVNKNQLMYPHHTDSATLSNRFSAFFHNKIQSIKANIMIDTSIPPLTELRYTGPRLAVFQPVITIEVHKLILSTPNKSCDLDPIPTTLLKQCCAELLPITIMYYNQRFTGVRCISK